MYDGSFEDWRRTELPVGLVLNSKYSQTNTQPNFQVGKGTLSPLGTSQLTLKSILNIVKEAGTGSPSQPDIWVRALSSLYPLHDLIHRRLINLILSLSKLLRRFERVIATFDCV